MRFLPDLAFLRDRVFLRQMIAIAGPVAFQQLISASLSMLDVLMVGQLGEAAIAALGLSNQIFFLLILMLFGLTSGMAIFTAQFWGKGEVDSIRQVLGLSLLASLGMASLFALAATLAPATVLSFYTRDTQVIELGRQYLRLVGPGYLLMAITTSYVAVLRSVNQVRLTVVASVAALALKAGLAYVLIFGRFGFPRLGVSGAGLATLVGWAAQCGLIIALVYLRRTPLAVNPLRLFQFSLPRAFFWRVAQTVTPATLNEIIWSLGITTYNAIYARIGTQAIAAVNVNATIEDLSFVGFMGLGSACAIMVGHRIGAGDREAAQEYARRFLWMCMLLALTIGLLILPARGLIAGLYNLTPQGQAYVRSLLLIYCLGGWVRIHNFILFVGALRAGGDTRFALVMEASSMWVVGVPMAALAAFVLRLPVTGVYALVLSEEVVKAFIIEWRYRSRRWMHDLVNAPAAAD